MKIEFKREQMLTGFQTVASVIPTRTPKPILRNVKLSATGQQLVLFATDTEISVKMEVLEASIDAPGDVLLPIDRFGAIVREASDEKMRMETDGNEVLVRGQRSEFHLPAANPDEYPISSDFAIDNYYEISGRSLAELIRRTSFATDNESSRYALGGVLLEFDNEKMIAVATDARRLAKMESPVMPVGGMASETASQTIVPLRALQLMDRLLGDHPETVAIAIGDNDIRMRTPAAQMMARLVEGRFPNWRDVVGRDPATVQVELCVGPLLSAVRQAAIVTDKESRSIDLIFREGLLELTCSTAEIGMSRIDLPISYQGNELPVPLDSKYLTEFLRVLELQKNVTFTTAGIDRAAEFKTDDGYLYMIMPMERRKKKTADSQKATVPA